MRKFKGILLLFAGLALASLLGVAALLWMPPHREATSEPLNLLIPRGSSLTSISRLLYQNEIIQHPQWFKVLLRLSGGAYKVRAGEFQFQKNMRMVDAILELYNGEPILHQVTLPEGWTARQMAEILAQAGLVNPTKFLSLVFSPQTVAKYHLQAPSLEGFLFPDTYSFSKVDGEERILDQLVQGLVNRWNRDYKADAEKQGMSFEKVITLASIVEKETGAANERELVASVFHNRLKKHMRLQSDPTTIYGIANFNGNLTKSDLQTPTPYNTYTIPALPPGPIASPGADSIRATLHPATTNYLYFVSNNHGSHIFSETYEQHARHVTTWQVEYFRKRKQQHLGKVAN